MKRFHLVLIGLCILGSVAHAGDDHDLAMRRGIAIDALAWAPLAGDCRYDFSLFENRTRRLTDTDLGRLRSIGFDFVRLAVDPGPFMQAQGAQRAALDLVLKHVVTRILSTNLSVIVDFHPGDQCDAYNARSLTNNVRGSRFHDYLQLLSRTARLLAGFRSPSVALEIMNEPPLSTPAWQPLLDAAYATVRAVAPDLVIVLEGGDEGQSSGLRAMDVSNFANDPDALFTFHYYAPYQFTHQGAPWNAVRYLAGVSYPALARPIDETLRATDHKIDTAAIPVPDKWVARLEAHRQLEQYWRSAFDLKNIVQDFDTTAQWARKNNIAPGRILLGEFGVLDGEMKPNPQFGLARALWFHDVRETAEAHGFLWAVWVYRGQGGFALADSSTGEITPTIVKALGLKATRQ